MRRARVAGALLSVLVLVAGCAASIDADQVDTDVRERFPQVEHLGTAELAEWLEEPGDAPVLLDVRAEAEYDVSHLAGARRAEDLEQAEVALAGAAWDTPIVVYCSVGVRSARLADELQRAGYSRVMNLEGSIFRWANEGRPLVADTGPTRVVHPYDDRWGQLLDRDLWSDER